jgi:hypothetical protein
MDHRSATLSNLHHAYAQTDGTYAFPNSREGDMLKQAKKEIEQLRATLEECRTCVNCMTLTGAHNRSHAARAHQVIDEALG